MKPINPPRLPGFFIVGTGATTFNTSPHIAFAAVIRFGPEIKRDAMLCLAEAKSCFV